MAELLDREHQTGEAAPAQADAAAPAAAQSAFSESAPPMKKKKKNRRKIVRRIITLILVLALAAGGIAWWKLRPDDSAAAEVITETVTRGSITSIVQGSGAAVAKDSASITLLSDGRVQEIYVAEGDYVHKGDRLYSIDSDDAQNAVTKAEKKVRAAKKELDRLAAAARDLNVRAPFAGILIDVADCPVGEEVLSGTKVATLVDNTKMLLPLYFSYTYENEIAVGMSAAVSIPSSMAQLTGVVHEIHKVQRVSEEGGMLFEADIAVDNPGTLTEKMTATATLDVGGETVYPYAPGELKWFRTKSLTTEITGDCASSKLYEYMPVSKGESVLSLTAESSEDAVEDQEMVLQQAEEALEKAKKTLDALNGVAPIDGTVLTLGITAGTDAKTGTVAVSIADTTTMIINAQIDEMNVSYAKPGMEVNVRLWEKEMVGTIESVSFTAKSENGVARFPIVISVDNTDGDIMTGAYVDYSFTASQSNDCLVVPIQCVKSAQTTNGESCKVLFVQADEPPENVADLPMDMAEVPAGFYPVIVEIGIADNYNVEILSGVEEFATVFAGVAQNNSSGMGMMF